MSESTRTDSNSTDSKSTAVTHDGVEVVCRSRASHDAVAHEPKTDETGEVVFDETGDPEPACGLPGNSLEDRRFLLVRASSLRYDGECKHCNGTASCSDGAGNMSPARRLRYGEDWGK